MVWQRHASSSLHQCKTLSCVWLNYLVCGLSNGFVWMAASPAPCVLRHVNNSGTTAVRKYPGPMLSDASVSVMLTLRELKCKELRPSSRLRNKPCGSWYIFAPQAVSTCSRFKERGATPDIGSHLWCQLLRSSYSCVNVLLLLLHRRRPTYAGDSVPAGSDATQRRCVVYSVSTQQ